MGIDILFRKFMFRFSYSSKARLAFIKTYGIVTLVCVVFFLQFKNCIQSPVCPNQVCRTVTARELGVYCPKFAPHPVYIHQAREDTARYLGLLLAPAEDFGNLAGAFLLHISFYNSILYYYQQYPQTLTTKSQYKLIILNIF